MDGVILLIIIVAFVINIAAALQFREIAELKGHDGSPYFWYCLFLAMAGWAMVIALPDLHARPSAQPAAPANSGKTAELEELMEANYKDSKKIYDSLYKWSVKLVALNTTEEDYETILSSVSRKATYLHYLLVVQGGPPEQLINITSKIYWPDGDVTDATWYWEKAGNGSRLGVCFDNNNNGFYTGTATGTMKVKLYNVKTGDFLGEASIEITE